MYSARFGIENDSGFNLDSGKPLTVPLLVTGSFIRTQNRGVRAVNYFDL